MLISVVITVYNKETLVLQCIESVINQTYKDLEIIIINDGSNDNSDFIINKYINDDRIRYNMQRNKGVSFSRNRGIELANGEYILFVDADDELPINSIDNLVRAIKNDVDIVVGNYIYKSSSRIRKNTELEENTFFDLNILKRIQTKYDMFISNGRPLSSACNKLYKKDFLINNGIHFEDDVLAEDRLFNLYCYCKYPKLIIVNEYTYIINIIKDSRSRSYIEEFNILNTNLTIKLYDFLCKNNVLEENKDLLFLNLINDIEKQHRYIYKYNKNINLDIKDSVNLIKENKLFKSILEEGVDKRYLKAINNNSKKWFLIIYIKIFIYIPSMIMPYFYFSNIALNMKSKIRSKKY